MIFRKEKMKLETYVREICIKILQIPKVAYSDYLKEDVERVLSEAEFDKFNARLENFRLLLIITCLIDKSSIGKINYTSEEISKVSFKTINSLFNENDKSENRLNDKLVVLESETSNFFEYFENNQNTNITENVFVYHLCMYYSNKIISEIETNVNKSGTIAALLNYNKNMISEYIEKTLKKVKLM